jgi:hypothetical protein
MGGTDTACVGTRSWMTTVPARRSPTRLARVLTIEVRIGMNRIGISTRNQSRPRTSACRKWMGPPSSRTTRTPIAALPSVFPFQNVSAATG